MIRRVCAVALLVLAASCGQKDTQSTTSTTSTVQTPSAGAPAGRAAAGTADVPGGAGNPPGYSNETAAKAHCASDEVVWLNLKSHIYHLKGTHFYGTTKNGEYTCRKEADAAGDRNSKS